MNEYVLQMEQGSQLLLQNNQNSYRFNEVDLSFNRVCTIVSQ